MGGIDPVYEDHSRIASPPGDAGNALHDLSGIHPARGPARARIYQINLPARPGFGHEFVRRRHGDVEVLQDSRPLLGLDELQDIGMIDPQGGHIGPPAPSTLLDHIRRGIEYAHEGDRPGGHTTGGAHHIVPGPQPGEGKARPSAALVDESHILEGIEYPRQGVLHRQNKAGR